MHSQKINKNDFQSSFVKNCRRLLSPNLNESGGVLYCNGDKFKKGLIYYLGLNPDVAKRQTIDDSISVIFSSKDNAYFDEDWNSEKHKYGIGKHPFQKNIKFLFDYLGYDLSDIRCSNLIFARNVDQQGCNFYHNANLFWEVHELIMDTICPKIFLVFGNSIISTYFFVKTHYLKYFGNNIHEDIIQSENENWSYCSFITNLFGNDILILGLPYFSRYIIISYNSYRKIAIQWIKKNN